MSDAAASSVAADAAPSRKRVKPLTKKKLDNCDILRAYHTNPHRDHFETGRKAAEGLLKMMHGQVKPAKAWRMQRMAPSPDGATMSCPSEVAPYPMISA